MILWGLSRVPWPQTSASICGVSYWFFLQHSWFKSPVHLPARALLGAECVINRMWGCVCLNRGEHTCPALISGACMHGREQFWVQVAACFFRKVCWAEVVLRSVVCSPGVKLRMTLSSSGPQTSPNQGRYLKVSLRNRHYPGSRLQNNGSFQPPLLDVWLITMTTTPLLKVSAGPASDTLLLGSPPPPARRMVCVALAAVVKRRHLFVSRGWKTFGFHRHSFSPPNFFCALCSLFPDSVPGCGSPAPNTHP